MFNEYREPLAAKERMLEQREHVATDGLCLNRFRGLIGSKLVVVREWVNAETVSHFFSPTSDRWWTSGFALFWFRLAQLPSRRNNGTTLQSRWCTCAFRDVVEADEVEVKHLSFRNKLCTDGVRAILISGDASSSGWWSCWFSMAKSSPLDVREIRSSEYFRAVSGSFELYLNIVGPLLLRICATEFTACPLLSLIADVDCDETIVDLRPTRFLSSCSNRLYFDPDATP